MMELKAINILHKDYIDYDDFFLSCEAFIGLKDEPYDYKVYNFNVISVKRLYNTLGECGVMLNRGWMIVRYYDECEISDALESIIQKSQNDSTAIAYSKISLYLRTEDV